MMRFAALLLCILLAVSVAHAQAPSQRVANAKHRILSGLKDPDSAKFRNVKAFKNGAVCGEFNAKNSYGGYIGYTYFGFTGTGDEIAPPQPNLTGDYAKFAADDFYKRCADAPAKN